MSQLTQIRIDEQEAAAGLLDLFVFAEQKWGVWGKLEESIAKVDYKKLSDEELDWFIEFMANVCFRVWRSNKEEPELNRVKEFDEGFTLWNYDWKGFKFAREKGSDEEVTTKGAIVLDKDKLSQAEIKWLRSKCK